MVTLSFLLAGSLIVLAVFQAGFAFVFIGLLRNYRPPRIADTELPRATILLPLRGADPYLGDGLRKLMTQNYPRYDIRIAVDHRDDPATRVVRDAEEATGFTEVTLRVIGEPSTRCSLKCGALARLAGDLGNETEIVVLADADLVSHPDWLRELIAPLVDDVRVGATYGNRWFWPEKAWWGSLVRYLWNVAAVVPMCLCRIPWGGTFAIRADVLRESKLPELWSRAAVEDAPVRSVLDARGLRLHFVPGLMMVNREDCSLPFSLDFIKRQLTWTRLYHPNWAVVVAHAILTTCTLAAALLLIPGALILKMPQAAVLAGSGILFYLLAMAGLMGGLESAVRKVVSNRGERVEKFSSAAWAKAIVAIPLAQFIHAAAVLLASFKRTVTWRGITYRIRSPQDIRMVEYRPFEPEEAPPKTKVSL